VRELRNWAAVTHALRGAMGRDEWMSLPGYERDALIDWANELNSSGGSTDI
jgi:hypothetical protein